MGLLTYWRGRNQSNEDNPKAVNPGAVNRSEQGSEDESKATRVPLEKTQALIDDCKVVFF